MEHGERLPTYFISHGGGPWPWLMDQSPGVFTKLHDSLTAIPLDIGVTPAAILMISGHWVAPQFTVQTHPHPPMLYDYGGFPEFTYHLQYPAPGSPATAERIEELFRAAQLPLRTDASRGFDHGTFAPLYVAYPDAEVPVLQLSLKQGYAPAEHLAAGRALAPLREEGVLLIGSGFSYHNLRMFGGGAVAPSAAFEEWLTGVLVDSPIEDRTNQLLRWDSAPGARESHPDADHLIPLMVAVGAAESDAGVRSYYESDFMGTVTSASYRFG